MTDPAAARAFLQGEVESLEPFDFVAVSPSAHPLATLEVTRREDRGLEVRVPGRPPTLPELSAAVRTGLHERGFASEDPADPTRPWAHAVSDAASAVELVQNLLVQVFGEKSEVALDVAHGSHRAEHETRQKIAAVRERIEKVLEKMIGARPKQDSDGDYVLPVNDVHVILAPRVAHNGPAVVRIFAITNVGVTIAPDLGLFLARMNFGLMFGRFALDAEHRAIWFDETVLGDQFSDDELRFIIEVVASTADEWDDRLKQMFGGATYQEVLANRDKGSEIPTLKPGQGGYI
ncbi:MAG: YbjN domain-containing protein [Myxococcales bacterium]|nr:YbjN domain-containing protein [Myxococcales bacterium]MDH5306204.1 YbjN domain-containing protein [Myxococcales bacterium]MDH5567673.1 YbjN domain-containing protein [Myxococcales bacterium]